MSAPSAVPAKTGFRTDLEGLRALAVILVVLYHAHVPFLTGGYIGVDVFYVLSGFFITGLLIKEINATGRVSLRAFYARRGRRLLPIATVVIIATSVAAWFVYPPLRLPSLGWDALASALNIANFRYAAQATDYLASTQDPSPFLHFWSLAVEEQFYWIWPLLIAVIVGALVRPLTRHLSRIRLAISLSVITVASFAASIWLTGVNQPWAFFLLPTRAWELAAGALIAVAGTRVDALPREVRVASGYVGVAVIAIASLTLTEQTAFPGWAALLPVAGTVLVLLSTTAPGSISSILSVGPMRAIGRWSYSIYLWHWPLLVLPAIAATAPLTLSARLMLALAAIPLGALSYRLVEHPVRMSRALIASNAKSLTASAGLVAAGAAAGAALIFLPGLVTASGPSVAAPTSATSQSTTLPETPDGPAPVPSNLTPALADVAGNLPASYGDGCHLDLSDTKFGTCVYGDPEGSTTVALLGDSHAAQWLPALSALGKTNGWKVVSLTKSACAATTAIGPHPSDKGRTYTECATAHDAALARIAQIKPDLVIMGSLASAAADQDPNVQTAWYAGLTSLADAATKAGAKKVLVLGDTPHPNRNIPECLSAHLDDSTPCNAKIALAVSAANEAKTQAAATAAGARYAQTSGWLCNTKACPAVVGNLLVYRDESHLTTQMAEWLAPKLETAVKAALH